MMPVWLEIVLRSSLLLVVLFFMTKGLGKRQISQLSIFDYITGIVLGGIVAMHSFDLELNLLHGLIAMLVWFVIPLVIDFLSLKSKAIRDFVQGKGTVFIKNGKIIEENLQKERFTSDDLLQELRRKDVFHVADVEFAILEPSGSLSVLPKKETQALTPEMIGLKVAPIKQPVTVIMDGKLLPEALESLSLNPNWVETELEKLDLSIENVFLAQVDQDGQISVDLYDDGKNIPEPTEKPLLLATLKKCQADLELFALETENEDSKQLYEFNSQKLKQAIEKLSPYI